MTIPVSSLNNLALQVVSRQPDNAPVKSSFSGIMEKIMKASAVIEGMRKEVTELHGKITSSSSLDFKDLINCQLRMGEFNLRVELVSKLADSLIAATKKLQQGQ